MKTRASTNGRPRSRSPKAKNSQSPRKSPQSPKSPKSPRKSPQSPKSPPILLKHKTTNNNNTNRKKPETLIEFSPRNALAIYGMLGSLNNRNTEYAKKLRNHQHLMGPNNLLILNTKGEWDPVKGKHYFKPVGIMRGRAWHRSKVSPNSR